jgi:hypothetical protein
MMRLTAQNLCGNGVAYDGPWQTMRNPAGEVADCMQDGADGTRVPLAQGPGKVVF